MKKIDIRKAKISDLQILQKLSIKTFNETFSAANNPENITTYIEKSFNTDQLTLELHDINSTFYISYLDNEPIGYLKLNSGAAQTESLNENMLEIQRIYVLKAFHGQKIGQLLLDQAKSIAKTNGYEFIWLGVWEHNIRALAFYTKNGFTTFDQHFFLMGNDKQTDLLMKLRLE